MPELGGYHGTVNRQHDATHPPSEAAQAYLLTLRSMEGSGTRAHDRIARSADACLRPGGVRDGQPPVASMGWSRSESDRTLAMTPAGWAAADTIFHRHALMEWLLTRVVGLGWAESDEEAMRLQGAISPRVEAAIDDLLGHPDHMSARQPHERCRGPCSDRAGIPLDQVASDSDITILRISEEAEEDAELLVYLEQQGLMPGVRAHVADVSQSRDSVTIDGPKGRTQHGPAPGIAHPGPARRCRPVALPPGPRGGRAARTVGAGSTDVLAGAHVRGSA